MVDFAKARSTMVDCQIRTVDVTDYDVLDAFLAVPREAFLPPALQPFAYIDEDLLVTPPGTTPRYVMEPGPLARLVQLADIGAGESVLDIGSTTGYSAAILSRLARSVVAVEPDETLAAAARATLAAQGATNVEIVSVPLAGGYPPKAPYDVIIVQGAVGFVPEGFFGQLAQNGRIIAVVGSNGLSAKATLYTRSGDSVSSRPAFNTHVRPLPGFAKPKEFVF